MSTRKSIAIALMDPPYETSRVTTAFRLIESALRRGIDVNVFAYEGAVALGFAAQKPHANSIKGTTLEQEQHPNTKDWLAGLVKLGDGQEGRGKLDWVNCGLCVDERGTQEQSGGRRGSPADFHAFINGSTNVLTIGTR